MSQNENGVSIRFSSRNSSQIFFLLNRLPAAEQETEIPPKVGYEVGQLIDEVLRLLVVHAAKYEEMEDGSTLSPQRCQTRILGHLF